MNRVILMGRLVADPEVRYSAGERTMAIARYRLAVPHYNKGQETADFITCVAFDRDGEFAEKYFMKGMRVLVSGRLQTGSYMNREGQKVYTCEVIVSTQEFADSKGAGLAAPQPAAMPGHDMGDGFMQIPDGVEDEGLPFN